jgi:peptidoglycan-associated lipoprotein
MNFKFAAAIGAAALIAASCASQPEEEVITEPETAPVVEDTGPVAGSVADFQQTAGDRVFFGFDQYSLTAETRETLSDQAAWLQSYPDVKIQVAGNCDERGTREYNLALGARRANAVKDYLVGLGVDPSRITTISYGKERPIDPRSNEEAWALNRNAHSVIVSGAVS